MPAARKGTPGDDTGLETARLLLSIGAVNFRPDEPYTLTSGWASPVYIDCRRVISFPEARGRIVEMAVDLIGREIGLKAIDGVAGGETAGIPYAAWIAEAANKPMLYVRKKPKGFGRDAQIEGHLEPGDRVLLVEDLATDGGSKVTFVEGLRSAGAEVADVFVVFFYGAFPGAEESMAGLGVTLHWLATWNEVLKAAQEGQYFNQAAIDGVAAFLDDPVGWSQAHGGRGADG